MKQKLIALAALPDVFAGLQVPAVSAESAPQNLLPSPHNSAARRALRQHDAGVDDLPPRQHLQRLLPSHGIVSICGAARSMTAENANGACTTTRSGF